MKHPQMESRGKWGSLPTRCDVTGSEVAYRCNTSALCNDRGIADLQAKGVLCAGAMTHGLSVAADGTDVLTFKPCLVADLVGSAGE